MAPPVGRKACQPGDFAVTRGPSGFVLSRVLKATGLGLQWEGMFIFSTLDEACRVASEAAGKSTGRAWLRLDGVRYLRLGPNGSERAPNEPAGQGWRLPRTVQA